jgi:7,8-dihydro-6-hydroxymethylpterin-pyrophosphokinase
MIVTRKNIFTGVERSLDLDVTQEGLNRWKNGELIQNVFPHLSVDEREFLMTGILGEEWNELMEDEVRDEFVYEL